MELLIIEYILNRITLKGSMEMHFDGRKIYHEDIIDHLMRVFNLDGFMANGYLSTCVFEIDSDFSYSHWALLVKPPEAEWLFEGVNFGMGDDGRRYFAGVDPAMGDDAQVMNFLVRERFGRVQFVQRDIPPIVNLPIP